MKIDDQIIQKYVDGILDESQRSAFEEQLMSDPDLEKRVNAYKFIDHSLKEAIDQTTVSVDFTNLVINNLNRSLPEKTNFWSTTRIIILSVVVLSFVAGFFLLYGNFNIQYLLPEISASNPVNDNVSITLDPNKYIDKEIFFKMMIYVNAFLALLLLDRAIFRPLFRHRKSAMTV